MEFIFRFIGACVFTYFTSRMTLRLPQPWSGARGTVVAHLLSLALLSGFVFVLRQQYHIFALKQLMIYAGAQGLWLGVDLIRRQRPASSTR